MVGKAVIELLLGEFPSLPDNYYNLYEIKDIMMLESKKIIDVCGLVQHVSDKVEVRIKTGELKHNVKCII